MARHNYWFYLLAVCSTLMIYLCLNQTVSNGKDTETLSAIQLETELIEHDRVETAAETRALGILGHGFAEESLIKPFINYTNNFLVASDVKLIYCPIQKSMSQLGSNIMCFLYNEQQFIARNQSFTDVIYVQENYCLNYQDFVNPTEKLRNHADTARFTFIRDPFDRFLSFYLDKCVKHNECYDCGKDMRCVVRRLYEGLQQIQRKDGKEDYMYAESHAAPLSWYCNFKNDIEKWELIKIGADKEKREAAIFQLARILKKKGVKQSSIDKITIESLVSETSHATHKSSERAEAERQLKEDLFVRDMLHKIYFNDYVVFQFSTEHLDQKYRNYFL